MRKWFQIIPFMVILLGAGCAKKSGVIEASGTVEVTQVDLASRIASRVASIAADEGAAVKKGDILARLDDRIVAAQKDAAAAMYEQVKATYERNSKLLNSQSITREQFDQSKAQFIKAESDLRQAAIMLDEANIYAPWDGTILKKNVEVGELVNVNTPLFTLGNLATAKVTIYVPLPDMGRIKLNQTARVMIDAFKNRAFEGRLTHIASEAEFTPKNVQTKDERVKEVFAVEITVPNPEFILKPGMPADVEIR